MHIESSPLKSFAFYVGCSGGLSSARFLLPLIPGHVQVAALPAAETCLAPRRATPAGDRPDQPSGSAWGGRGIALTATTANMGELTQVQLLHEQMAYPGLTLEHVFVAKRCADVAPFALLLLLTQQGLQTAMVLPISLLRRVITLWSMVALAAAVGTLPLSAGVQPRRDS